MAAFIINSMDDPDSAIVDILANMMHYCQQTRQDFEASLGMARNHFDEETRHNENN